MTDAIHRAVVAIMLSYVLAACAPASQSNFSTPYIAVWNPDDGSQFRATRMPIVVTVAPTDTPIATQTTVPTATATATSTQPALSPTPGATKAIPVSGRIVDVRKVDENSYGITLAIDYELIALDGQPDKYYAWVRGDNDEDKRLGLIQRGVPWGSGTGTAGVGIDPLTCQGAFTTQTVIAELWASTRQSLPGQTNLTAMLVDRVVESIAKTWCA